jgi:hypothetical protein
LIGYLANNSNTVRHSRMAATVIALEKPGKPTARA